MIQQQQQQQQDGLHSRTSSPAFSSISSSSSTSSGYHSSSNQASSSMSSMGFPPPLNPLNPLSQLNPMFSPGNYANYLSQLNQLNQLSQPAAAAYLNNLMAQQELHRLNQELQRSHPGAAANLLFNQLNQLNQLNTGISQDQTFVDKSSFDSVSSSLSSSMSSPRNSSPIDLAFNVAPEAGSSGFDLSNVFADLNLIQSTGDHEKQQQQQEDVKEELSSCLLSDFEQKKLMAVKAMQTKPNANDFRVPTPVWSGYGFSQSIPHISSTVTSTDNPNSNPTQDSGTSCSLWAKEITTPSSSCQDGEGMNNFGASNYLENTSNLQLTKITSSHRHTDLASMLTSVGLDKYIRRFTSFLFFYFIFSLFKVLTVCLTIADLFTSHEVDMATFPTLSEKDLNEIGITAWGARRKIMLLIAGNYFNSPPFFY